MRMRANYGYTTTNHRYAADHRFAQAARRMEQRLWKGLIVTILVVGAFIMSLPFVWLVSSSFKLEEKIFVFPPEWIPDPFRPQNYIDALLYKPFGLYFFNTMRIVALNLVAILLSASFCGYGFARIRFPWS
jgi:multiple sugar transport system permease protein